MSQMTHLDKSWFFGLFFCSTWDKNEISGFFDFFFKMYTLFQDSTITVTLITNLDNQIHNKIIVCTT